MARAIDSGDGVRAIRRTASAEPNHSLQLASMAHMPAPSSAAEDFAAYLTIHKPLPRIVFAHTRYVYDSYRDYRRLVEVSGFPTCYLDECAWDDPDAAFITTPPNGEFPYDRALSRKCKLVLWDLERPDSEGLRDVSESLHKFDGRADAIWVSDRHYATLDGRYTFVPMGSDHRLRGSDSNPELTYDFCHESYVYGRRDAPFAALRSRLREGPAGRRDGQRDELLHRSRLMVNVHQTPAAVGEPLRFALAAAYALPLVSETLNDSFPMRPSEHFVMATLDEVPDAVHRTLGRSDRTEIGRRLQQLLCDTLTFERCVKSAVSRL
jgi:hypothetical protein